MQRYQNIKTFSYFEVSLATRAEGGQGNFYVAIAAAYSSLASADSRSQCWAGVPNTTSSVRARRKYRCAESSQVKPMPPWIWTFAFAALRSASEHTALAMLARQ